MAAHCRTEGDAQGSGTINGMGDYGFLLSAIDAAMAPGTDVDLFRIKIWDKNNGDAVVYDNEVVASENADPSTEISGGSIVIHKVKKDAIRRPHSEGTRPIG